MHSKEPFRDAVLPELPHWDSILAAEMQPTACMSVRLREGNNQVQNEQSQWLRGTLLLLF